MNEPSPEPHVDLVVDAFLAETGAEPEIELREALVQLRRLAATATPAPSAELESLMGDGAPIVLLSSRRRTIVLVTLAAVSVSLGLGVSTAAAVSPVFRQTAEDTFTAIVHAVAPGLGTGAPVPAPHKSAPPLVVTPTTEPSAVPAPNDSTPRTSHPTPPPTSQRGEGTDHRPVDPPTPTHSGKAVHPTHPAHP
jgi:hypothetical protein